MVVVAPVERRVQRARVKDQRHERGSRRSSADLRAVSRTPEEPAPRLRGGGRQPFSFSSIASRTIVAIGTPRSAARRRSRDRSSSGMVIVVRSMP